MRISKLRMQNFRCFLDETVVFDDYTCLVGRGGAGKSTILTALRIFFRDNTGSPTDLQNLREEFYRQRDTAKDAVITVTFSDLEPEAQEDLKHYVRQGQLVVSAIARWNQESRSAPVKQFGERLGMAAFKEFFKADGDGAAAAQLKLLYSEIRKGIPELPPPGTKPAMAAALSEFETQHTERCELLPAEDRFYGAATGRLEKYLQWVFVPAVKDASTEQLEGKKTALGLLLDRTVRSKMSFSMPLAELRAEVEGKYKTLLEQNQSVLENLSTSLSSRLRDWAHPDTTLALVWRNDPSRAISIADPLAEVLAGEGQFRGSISHFGHGLQRSFLLALLQELSGCGDTGNPKLLLACEEPELYQHPPQARHLSSVLQKLSRINTQVIVSSHSPYFISGKGFQDLRILRRDVMDVQPSVKSVTFDQLSTKLAEALGEQIAMPTAMEFKVEQALQTSLNEMFYTSVLILVEGLEDLAYVSTYLTLTNRMEEFRRLGCHLVPTSGKGGMVQPLAIAKMLDIPTYIVFDADGHDVTRPGRKDQHERDNLALLRLCAVDKPMPFPATVFQTDSLTMWPTEIGDAIEADIGKSDWEQAESTVRKKRRIMSVPKLDKNMLFIGSVLTELYEQKKVSGVLEGLCSQIISFAQLSK